MKHTVKGLFIGALAIGLAACSGSDNPLLINPPKESVKFLIVASQYAEQALHIYHAPGGEIYGQCIEDSATGVDCDALYKTMVIYAKDNKKFQAVTVSDLTSSTMWKKLSDDYHQELFNTI